MSRKKTKDKSAMIVAVVAIILIIIIGTTANQRDNITIVEKWVGNIVTPLQRVVNTGVSSLGGNISSISTLSQLRRDNTELKEKVETLEKDILNMSMTRSELEELKSLKYTLNFIENESAYNVVTASVVGKSPGNWFNIFTIDAGENQGIKRDSVVLDSNGLVGRIYEVGGNWSKVISIIDNNSSVSFQILRDSSLQGVVTGSITNEVTGYLFDPLADIIVGDKIVTSGLGIFPKGILIGEIVEVDKSGDYLLKTIKVEPAGNFKRITKVLIMEQRQFDN